MRTTIAMMTSALTVTSTGQMPDSEERARVRSAVAIRRLLICKARLTKFLEKKS